MLRNIQNCTEILENYRVSSEKEFKRKYKIIMNKDGTIFDTILKKRYNNLSQWANSMKEQYDKLY
jgi:hypothetical protein